MIGNLQHSPERANAGIFEFLAPIFPVYHHDIGNSILFVGDLQDSGHWKKPKIKGLISRFL
jgi:hypothetical protein